MTSFSNIPKDLYYPLAQKNYTHINTLKKIEIEEHFPDLPDNFDNQITEDYQNDFIDQSSYDIRVNFDKFRIIQLI